MQSGTYQNISFVFECELNKTCEGCPGYRQGMLRRDAACPSEHNRANNADK